MDAKMAMQWCVRGAEAGSAAAMLTLGECLRDGVGVDQDLTVWLERARMAREKKRIKK
jgi:TPR repeat protein